MAALLLHNVLDRTFQRIESGKVIFDFPFNPLIVPQICLRFSDIANVGVTGRHYTSFCMIGQHALANSKGYWRDRCVEMDFKLLTEEFGIDKKEVVFKEDVRLGPGAFGNSLEYYVRGLEPRERRLHRVRRDHIKNYKEYPEKGAIHMGAGLERFVWPLQEHTTVTTQCLPQSWRSCTKRPGCQSESDRSLDGYFKLAGSLNIDQFKGAVADYSSIARELGLPEEQSKEKIEQIQSVYSIVESHQNVAVWYSRRHATRQRGRRIQPSSYF